MEGDVLQKVLERAFSDQPFRSRLEADLDEALAGGGYKLTPDQRRQLKGILEEGRDTFATGLDQRLSQSGVSLSPQALLRQKSKAGDRGDGLTVRSGEAAARKQPPRQVKAEEGSGPRGNRPEKDHREAVDDREPDYEVETD